MFAPLGSLYQEKDDIPYNYLHIQGLQETLYLKSLTAIIAETLLVRC